MCRLTSEPVASYDPAPALNERDTGLRNVDVGSELRWRVDNGVSGNYPPSRSYGDNGPARPAVGGPMKGKAVSRPRSSLHAPTPSVHADLRRPEGQNHPRLDDTFNTRLPLLGDPLHNSIDVDARTLCHVIEFVHVGCVIHVWMSLVPQNPHWQSFAHRVPCREDINGSGVVGQTLTTGHRQKPDRPGGTWYFRRASLRQLLPAVRLIGHPVRAHGRFDIEVVNAVVIPLCYSAAGRIDAPPQFCFDQVGQFIQLRGPLLTGHVDARLL